MISCIIHCFLFFFRPFIPRAAIHDEFQMLLVCCQLYLVFSLSTNLGKTDTIRDCGHKLLLSLLVYDISYIVLINMFIRYYVSHGFF